MKLAEALLLRSDLQKKIDELKVRLERSAKVQEGEFPPEEPDVLLKELDNCIESLIDIVQKINRVNATKEITGVGTISSALAKRDILILKRNVLSALMSEAAVRQNRYSGSEIKILSTVNISDIQKQIDDISAEYRILDTKIQEQNWLTEID